MARKELTSRTCIRLPDGTVLPVSTIHDVGGPDMRVEHHLPPEEWEQMVQIMMKRTGEVMSDYYNASQST